MKATGSSELEGNVGTVKLQSLQSCQCNVLDIKETNGVLVSK